jgi:CelD/BcsL family acetyltransferase involved in cellulose biosynthesis
MTREFEITTVSDAAGLAALQHEWHRLLERAGHEHPFTTHEWVRTWWNAFGDDAELNILVVRRHGECVGIAPLMLRSTRMYGLPVRQLGFIANDHTPRFDMIVAEPRAAVERAIWDHLLETRGAWDVLLLRQLEERSPTIGAVERLSAEGGVRVGLWESSASPILRIEGDHATYMRSMSTKLRKHLGNKFRRLQDIAPVRGRIVRDGMNEIEAALGQGYRIEACAWKADNGTAILSAPDVQRFYTELAHAAAARGWLELRFLDVGDRPIAFAYCLRYRGVIYLLKQGYDPELRSYSPSQQLTQMMIRDCYDQHLTALDFLGGDDDWKVRWSTERRPHRWLFAFAPRTGPRFLHTVKFSIAPALREGRVGALMRRAFSGATATNPS